MFTAKFRDTDAWQVSRCYQRRPVKGLNGSITTDPIIKIPASPVAILATAQHNCTFPFFNHRQSYLGVELPSI
ncbi:MAG: hypothetical protein OEV52_05670, partial [Dehalococcoidia bacterium]|nr:hypothetical protein [Dehalococcoidia bacterium]